MAKQTINDLALPLAFSGAAQLKLYTRYGDPRATGFEQKWLTYWEIKKDFPWFPKKNICIHKHFKTLLEAAFKDLELQGLYTEIKTCDGDYKLRMLRGSKGAMSLHSWGAALDLNADENPLGSAGQWSEAFIQVMEQHGTCCGQSWTGRRDPMHFAMANG